MRQNMLLTNPQVRPTGLTQTHLMVDYVYVTDTDFHFHSIQGNVITVPIDVTLQNFLIALENTAKGIFDVP